MAGTESRRPAGLTYPDYPGLYQSADQASLQGQRVYLRAVRARLLLTVAAAVTAALTLAAGPERVDLAAVATALLFVGALAVDTLVLQRQPDRSWYTGRALAESVKTLSWRYAVGGAPFGLQLPPDEADSAFVERLSALRRDLASVQLPPTRAAVISDRLRELRASPPDVRRRAYLADRIGDQQDWYADRSEFHHRQARRYGAVVLALEVAGVACALAKAAGFVDVDLAGIAAAMVAAFAAWSATRQHSTTASAYALATHELGLVRERLRRDSAEADWSAGVADAEAAISREHSTWRSSHG
ncbi:DUF4231 domain-containing protein [Allonocardiopsis opalescens]|uniref:Uncharacterized protein DUF4231 n=1 Tax=Allonocardiopsis opalescens TaxID=1144618 RepID=A0A2T0Q2Q0_9ACTN|nr:DUF4231 domain-containing protein [Allonocardiopsis opalescens]PRX98000.1 uncharacterized protein DUF4231 [Allonocardiopsis opalescens]